MSDFFSPELLRLISIGVGIIGALLAGLRVIIKFMDVRFNSLDEKQNERERTSLDFRDNIERQVEHIASNVNDLRADVSDLREDMAYIKGAQAALMSKDECRTRHDSVQGKVERIAEEVAVVKAEQQGVRQKLYSAQCVAGDGWPKSFLQQPTPNMFGD